jgi:hypothetical protein
MVQEVSAKFKNKILVYVQRYGYPNPPIPLKESKMDELANFTLKFFVMNHICMIFVRYTKPTKNFD